MSSWCGCVCVCAVSVCVREWRGEGGCVLGGRGREARASAGGQNAIWRSEGGDRCAWEAVTICVAVEPFKGSIARLIAARISLGADTTGRREAVCMRVVWTT